MRLLFAIIILCIWPSSLAQVTQHKKEYFYLKVVGPYWQSWGPHDEPDPNAKFLEELLK